MRHIYVTVLLFGLLISQPFLSGITTHIVFLAVVTLTGWLLPATSRKFMIGIGVLAFISVAWELLGYMSAAHVPSLASVPGGLLVTAVIVWILLYCAGSILWALLKADEVCMDVVVASVNFYLILGFIWAYIYGLTAEFSPDAFQVGAARGHQAPSFVYFSFVTMTTLGYGDIIPRTPTAQMLASLEAVIGQLYVPVVVAYLLTLHTGRKLESEKEDSQ